MVADQQILQQLPEMGRATDTVLAHMSLGEVVIPRAFLDDPDTLEAIQSIFEAYGVNMAEFTVGDPANKINPETGYPEFFLKKVFKAVKKVVKKIAPIALPILGTMIPGVGPVVGGALGGALGGAVSGKGLKGVLTGGALGAAGGGLSSALGGSGGLLGKAGGTFGPATASQVAGAGSTNAALSGLAQGTGIRGALSSIGSGGGLSSLTGSGGSGMFGNALKIGGAVFEDSGTRKNNKEMEQRLLQAQGRAQEYLNPYTQAGSAATGQLSQALSAGFQPGDLTQDPGYQFRLQEGEQALQRRMASSGLGQSGAALKAAQEYGQGLADQTYNDAYQRWLSGNSQLQTTANMGLGAADASSELASDVGFIQAQKLAADRESKNKRLSGILSGIGAFF